MRALARRVLPFSPLAIALALVGAAPSATAGIPLTGRVLGPDGAALPEATVMLLAATSPVDAARRALAGAAHGEPVATGRTDARGAYRLEAPRAGLYTLRIEAPGHAPLAAWLGGLVEEADLPDAELEADAGLSVTVRGAGDAPLAGALVAVRRDTSGRSFGGGFWYPAPRVALTGPEGTARLPRGAKELLIVGAAAPGLAPAVRSGRLPASLVLTPAAAAALPVEVRGADGKPVAGAVVLAEDAGLPLAWSGADGRAALVLPAAGLAVSVEAADDRSLTARLAPPPEEPQPPKVATLTLPAVTAVTGRVIDAQTRKPLAGALVYLPSSRRELAVTDDGGRYTLRVPAGRANTIRAAAPGYRRGGEAAALEAAPTGTRGPTLALEPAARVEGTVADEQGRPLPGALVTASENDPRFGGGRRMMRRALRDREAGEQARSDAQGRVRIGGLDPARGYTLGAELTGWAPAELEVNGLRPRQTRGGLALVMKPGARATGRVTDADGQPLAGVEIRAGATPEGGSSRFFTISLGGEASTRPDATTDAEGAFALADLKPGRYDVTARRRGFATKTVPGLEVAAAAAPVDLGTIALEPAARIEGTVTAPGGAPVEGVEVRAVPGGPFPILPGMRPPGDPDATTGSDGWFAIEDRRAGEKVDLMFWHTGFVTERRPGIEAGAAAPLAVELRPSSRVSGTVVAGDKPVAGARVMLQRSITGGTGMGAFVVFGGGDWAETDDTGSFVFESVEPGKISLQARVDGYQEKKVDEVEVPAGEDVEGLQLALEPGSVVEGTALLADGRPAIGARVELVETGERRGPRFMSNSASSDGDGRFRLEGLKPGPASIAAVHDEYGRAVKDLELRAGTNRLDLTFPGGQTVSGRVVDAGGAPIAGALVEVQPAGQRWGGSESTTGPDGAFAVEGVQDGSYTLAATRQGFAPAVDGPKIEVKGAPVAGLTVTLNAGGVLAGTLQGLPPEEFASVSVNAWSAAGWGSGSVDFKGNYRIADLAPGRYTVRAMSRDAGRSASGEVEIVAGTPETRLDLDFGKGLTLSGRALLGEQPVAGAAIWARGRTVQGFGQGRTDSEGAFRIEGLEPGTYELTLNLFEKGLTYNETVELAESRELTLRLPTAKVEGRVVDALDRAAVAGVSVTLAPEGQAEEPGFFRGGYGGLSAESGRFSIANVAPGTYRLSAKKEGYAAHTESVVVASGQDAANLELTLNPTEGLSLQVRLPGGGIPDVVFASVLDGAGRTVTGGRYPTGEAGRVRLPVVPPGSWEVLVQAANSAVATLQATAPGGPVPVQLAPATQLTLRVKELEGSKLIATVRVVGADGRLHRTIGWGAGARAEREAAEGRTTLEDLPAGSWTVTVTAPDGRTWQGSATTAPGVPAELVL